MVIDVMLKEVEVQWKGWLLNESERCSIYIYSVRRQSYIAYFISGLVGIVFHALGQEQS